MNIFWSLIRESIFLILVIFVKNLIVVVDYEFFLELKNLEYKRNIVCVMFEKILLNVDLVFIFLGFSCCWIIDVYIWVIDI